MQAVTIPWNLSMKRAPRALLRGFQMDKRRTPILQRVYHYQRQKGSMTRACGLNVEERGEWKIEDDVK